MVKALIKSSLLFAIAGYDQKLRPMQLALLRRLSSVECISAVAVISSPRNALKFITLLVDFIRQIYEPPVKVTQMHNDGIHHNHLNSVTTNPGVRSGRATLLGGPWAAL
jgi:hypothetical protein